MTDINKLAPIEKASSWDDVQEKAKRMILSGQVVLHRNGYQAVVGTVIGDHGVYQVETL
jgi:hypothetical protein